MNGKKIVGINVFHPDASAAAVVDGEFRSGVEEERFTRVKHWAGLPEASLRHCLTEIDAQVGDLTAIAVSRQPRAYLLKKASLALRHPRGLKRALGRVANLVDVASLEQRLREVLGPTDRMPRIHSVEHHLAHVASAFFCSPFDEAACLTVDGFGDFVSTMLAVGRGNTIEVLDRVHYPHSLGLFYTAITQYLGFTKFGDEYKVMGLTAYGEPSYADALRKVAPQTSNGLFQLDQRYFRHLTDGIDMTWDGGVPRLAPVFTPVLEELLGPSRRPDEELGQRHKDIAASLQQVYEERFFSLVREVVRRTGCKRLALAGGCAFNSLANGRLLDQVELDDIYIQAAAGDAGTALGAALYVHHAEMGAEREFVMEHAYWGPGYSDEEIRSAIADKIPAASAGDGTFGEFEIKRARDEDELATETASAIAGGEVVGWYQGRSEWGPRALGNRSIVADPRRADMRDVLNLKIKRRESFRPFAPSILEERTGEWFSIDRPDPFMLKVYPIRPEKRAEIPAVTHVDGTGRLQTVSKTTNSRYWNLIRAFEKLTGVPLILNTSFNENEPIVNEPGEALDCFLRTNMDRIVLGDWIVRRCAPSS